MKLKKIVITGAPKEFEIRMVKEACTPKIAGLFLQDENLNWTAAALTVDA
jgi:hypothetical protein